MHRAASVLLPGLLLLPSAIPAERPSPFTNQSKPRTVKVTILAVSSSSRQSFAGNQEVYLADLVDSRGPRKGEHQFVRLIDQYPGYGLPIRDSLLRDRTLFRMKATREPECDLPASQIFLANAPKVIFNQAVQQTLQQHQNQTVPCYKSIHTSIKISKQ